MPAAPASDALDSSHISSNLATAFLVTRTLLKRNQRHRISFLGFQHQNVGQVARRQIEVFVQFVGNNQKIAFQAHAPDFWANSLVFGASMARSSTNQTILTGQLREDRSHAGAEHLLD